MRELGVHLTKRALCNSILLMHFYWWFQFFSCSFVTDHQEAEENAAARQAKIEQHAANAAAAAAAAAEPPEQHIAKSPSDFSCHSYELFVGQEKGNDDNNKEKMSIRSEGLESVSEITRTTAPTANALASAKARKVSTVSMSECFAC